MTHDRTSTEAGAFGRPGRLVERGARPGEVRFPAVVVVTSLNRLRPGPLAGGATRSTFAPVSCLSGAAVGGAVCARDIHSPGYSPRNLRVLVALRPLASKLDNV